MGCAWYFIERVEHRETPALRRLHHEVCPLRRTAHAQHRVTASEQSLGDRMENLVERGVANPFGASERHERKGLEARVATSDSWIRSRTGIRERHVAGPEERKRIGFHGVDILRQLHRIISSSGAVGSRDKDK